MMDLMDIDLDMDLDQDSQPLAPSNRGGTKMSRAEKSRRAAKDRRDKENFAMRDLMEELPVSEEVLNKMDKTSIIRLAICYIRIKHYVQKDILAATSNGNFNGSFGNKVKPPLAIAAGNKSKEPVFDIPGLEEGQLMLDALNGFLIYVSKKGKIQFVSKTVEEHIGLKQVHMIGKSVTDFVHKADHPELVKQFTKANTSTEGRLALTEHEGYISFADDDRKVFYLRMKYSLPKPGSKAKNEGYMLVQWSGKIKRHRSTKTGKVTTDGLLCICRPMQTTSILEIRMDGNMFMSRHDLKMTFTFCDTRIITLIGYEPNEVIGKTAYYFHNPLDAPRVSDCHSNLIVKGTSVSKYYRFLGKNSDWVWLQTRATIIYNTSNKPQYIVCMNYVISEEEGERFLMLEEQKQNSLTLPDGFDEIAISCKNTGKAAGPQVVEITSDEDDDDDDDDIRKPLPQPQIAVKHTPVHEGQKRICIRIPAQPEQPARSQVPVSQTNLVTTTQAHQMPVKQMTINQQIINEPTITQPTLNQPTLTQPTLNQSTISQPTLNQSTISQPTLIQSTISQPTFSQTSMCQTTPCMIDPAYSVVSQGQEFQVESSIPLDVKTPVLSGIDCGLSGTVTSSFAQDLNTGMLPEVSMTTQEFPNLQVSPSSYSNDSSPTGSNASSPPYSRKVYVNAHGGKNSQNIAFEPSQGNLSDGGYESATSPYSSTNTTSPIQNIDLLQEESTHSVIQGDNTFLGVGYSSSPPVSISNPEISGTNTVYSRDNLQAEGLGIDVLDELLQSICQETGNIDYSSSIVNNIINNNNKGHPINNTDSSGVYSQSPERPDSRSNDRPFLRSLLNMPENDIPKTPVSFHAGVDSPSADSNSPFSPRSDVYDSDGQHSGFSPMTTNSNNTNVQSSASKSMLNNDTPNQDYMKMEITDVPQDISDFALNYLETLTEGQTLSDLGSDILMDTGDESDFSKFVSSILTQPDTAPPQCAASGSASKLGHVSVNKMQTKSQFPKVVNQSGQGKQTGSLFSVPCAPKSNKQGAQSTTKQSQYGLHNNSRFTSLHVDHGYHQTKVTKNQFSKMRSPNVSGQNFNSRPPYQGQKSCRVQSRDTMSQLEKQLRGWGRDSCTQDSCGSSRNGQPKSFLEQFLTGELTKDRYIEMEKERCRYMKDSHA